MEKQISDFICNWLNGYAERNNKNFVVGVSGGVDSAVVSTLCALTGRKTFCVSLPIHQAESHLSRAENHISFLQKNFPNCQSLNIDLTKCFDTIEQTLPDSKDKNLNDLSFANLRSRLRMLVLYHLAAINNALVVGTGNKIEDFEIGFFTKWGDGACDISPIADLTKTEVWKVAKYLGISDDIINAEPSDGLFDEEKTDEFQIGASYKELEWAMEESKKGKSQDDFYGREKNIMQIFLKRKQDNSHKINPIPVCKIDFKKK